ncbi:MAG: hypothetical protein EKK55_22485 [Rhodocyclaceae bacterium]|nr:MAG: hypothetical protein EKK55_22485 [Rhodocyclaceae bacterium]
MNTMKKILLYVKLAFYTKISVLFVFYFTGHSIVYLLFSFYYLNVNLIGMLIDSSAEARGVAIFIFLIVSFFASLIGAFLIDSLSIAQFLEKKREQISRQLQNLQQSNKHHNQWSEEDEL